MRPLIDDSVGPGDARRIACACTGDPLLRRSVVSDDGTTVALNVSFRKMTDLELITRDLDGHITRIVADEPQTEPARTSPAGRT